MVFLKSLKEIKLGIELNMSFQDLLFKNRFI